VTNRPCRSGVDDPLVIAIEGLCYAGKTTLAYVLAPVVSGVVIPEYGELAAAPPFPPGDLDDVASALRHFLRLERERAAAARDANAAVVLARPKPDEPTDQSY
jgi:hypothetical protein